MKIFMNSHSVFQKMRRSKLEIALHRRNRENQSPMKLKFLSAIAFSICIGANAAVRDISKLGARGDGETLNTKIIQDAINSCSPGDTVSIPAGTFVSGALFLKSDMTLQIDGTLKGSTNVADYPMIPCRFEGFEMNCYASLLTLGKRDHADPFN